MSFYIKKKKNTNKNLYFHKICKLRVGISWEAEGCWPLISSDWHPGDTVTEGPVPTGLPANDYPYARRQASRQLLIRCLAVTLMQYCY